MKPPSPSSRQPIHGRSAWYGIRIRHSDEWIYRLASREIAEIETAVTDVQRRGLELKDVVRDDFVLPTLGPRLAAIQHEVVRGRGFGVIRGLPVDGYSLETAALAFWGIGTHLGRAVSQNAKGHLLGHVKDIGHDPGNPLHRIYATHARQPFHTDSCDIVGLLCVKTARHGGRSSVVSSVTIYNEMLARRPDLVDELARPLCYDRKGEIPAGQDPYYLMPVFNFYEGMLSTFYARDFIEGAQRFEEVPRLTPRQVEALDLLDALAASDALRLDMELAPGDMQFLHNHQTLHARTAYEDDPDPAEKRHLLRLWLSPPNGRPLPPAFAQRYGSVEVGSRGGIVVSGAVLCTPLEAQ